MKKVYSDLQKYYAQRRGKKAWSNLDTKEQDLGQDAINIVRDTIWFWKQWGWNRKVLQFTTEPTYNTGTCSGSAGSPYVTISGPTLTALNGHLPFRGAWFASGEAMHKIIRADTVNNRFVLASQLKADITAGSSYNVYFLEYPVRNDIGEIREARIDNDPLEIAEGTFLIPKEYDVGTPEILYNAGQTEEDYDTGTGTFTKDSNEVTSVSGVTLDTELIGKAITPTDLEDTYYIVDVDNGSTKIYLDRPYSGTTLAANAFTIDPVGTPLLGLYPLVSTRNLVRIDYTWRPQRMRNDNDRSLLPDDTPLLVGIDLLTTKWETVGERGFINEVLFTDKKFKEAINKHIGSTGSSTRKRLRTVHELSNRNLKRDTNPWNRR